MKNRIGNLPLVFRGQPDNFGLLDGAARGFIGRGYHKIGERSPLDRRGAFQARENLVRQARLQTGDRLGAPVSYSSYGKLPYKSISQSPPTRSRYLHNSISLSFHDLQKPRAKTADPISYIDSERTAIVQMSPELKIETNRANAQLSTGPRTEEGKAASSQNARKHGLTARHLAIKPEDQEEFDEMLAGYQIEINPTGAIEQTLFDEIVAAAWNLRRIRVLQSELDPLDLQYDRLARHHTRFERTFHRTLKELKALQTDRTLHGRLRQDDRERTPLLASPQQISKRSQDIDRQVKAMMRERTREAEMRATDWRPPAAGRSSGSPSRAGV